MDLGLGSIEVKLQCKVKSTEIKETSSEFNLFAEIDFIMNDKVIDTLKWHKSIIKKKDSAIIGGTGNYLKFDETADLKFDEEYLIRLANALVPYLE